MEADMSDEFRFHLEARAAHLVSRQIIGESLAPVGLGLIAGLIASLMLTPFLEGMLYGVKAADPFSIGAAAIFLVASATAAAIIPARRASQVDPITALRYD